MDKQKLLSIVIPTYNMEKYLAKCLDSLVNARKALPRLEILVINDGSKDASSEIAHTYQTKYADSIIVIDKENGNYGSCINRGLKEATGKYIKVLDADDYFVTENLESLVNILAKLDVDLVLTDFDAVDSHEKVINKIRFSFPKDKILKIEHYCYQHEFTQMQMHAVTYRTAMVKEIGYHQTEGISYTDVEWIFEPMSYVNTFYYSNLIVYQYLKGREGQTMNPSQLQKNIMHTLKGMYSIFNAFKRRENICGENMYRYLMSKMITRLHYLYTTTLFMRFLTIETLTELDDFIKEKDMNVYQATDKIVVHRLLPFHYVRWWRKHNRQTFPHWITAIYGIAWRIKVQN